MVFRGVVTIGDAVIADENIYLGKAIVEAAELFEKAEGAFVWLSPGACELPVDDDRLRGPLVKYAVPLKGGQTVETYVVNPFTHASSSLNADDPIRRGIEDAMQGDRVDIVMKRQNTLLFLGHVVETDIGPIPRLHDQPL